MRRRSLNGIALVVALAVPAIGLSACGGDDDAPDATAVLDDTVSSVTAQRQGSLSLRMVVFGDDPESGDVRRVGFEIVSRFDLTTGKRLPVADISYLALHGGEETQWQFASTGDVAFVTRSGDAFGVPPSGEAQVAAMASAVDALDGIGAWVRNPTATDDVNVDTVRGDVDGVAVLHDVFALGAAVEPTNALPDPGTVPDDALAGSVRSGTFELQTLKADGSLGHLRTVVVLDPAPYPEVQALLGGPSALRLEVEVSAGPLDGAFVVDAPPELRPWEELPPV